MKKNYDINKVFDMAKLRKKPAFLTLFFVVLLMVATGVVLEFSQEFKLNSDQLQILIIASYISMLFYVQLFLISLLKIIRPTNILKYDLKYIYIVKKRNKPIEISVGEIRNVKSKVKSSKKAKKPHGNVTIITTDRKRYKVKNIYDPKEVEKEVIRCVEKLQIYLEGVRQGSGEPEKKKKRWFRK